MTHAAAEAVSLVEEISAHVDENLYLESLRWTQPQIDYLSASARLVLWRAANQAGKSMVLAAALAWALNGDTAGGRDPAG